MQIKFTELTDSQWQVIEKHLSNHTPKWHKLRRMVNAILWVTRTGSQWRNMESKYPKWQSVYYYFRIWKKNGTLSNILRELVEKERIRKGRSVRPSAAAVDSQSVKISSFIDEATGIDGGKKVNGRKRHFMVDAEGLPLAIYVGSADQSDALGGFELLTQAEYLQGDLKLIRGDQHYAKIFKEAASWYQMEVDTQQRPSSEKGFVPQKGRWQVERSFGWANFFRRLSRDYEKLPCSSVAFIQWMFVTIILARIDK